jgi:translocator assembly and maintenance protein 41
VKTIKYGVTTVDNLCTDLLHWRSLYLAGRMHKPIRIIKDDARVRLTQQVNLISAIRTALLTLPSSFSETTLYERIAGLSYAGDPRMVLPAENRGKVANIVKKQGVQFAELYNRLVTVLPGVDWADGGETIRQDVSPNARAAHLRKLPLTLSERVQRRMSALPNLPVKETDESAYWAHIAAAPRLQKVLNDGMSLSSRNTPLNMY